MSERLWVRSLHFRLLAATLLALSIALALGGVVLGGLFRDHVLRQFTSALMAQLDHVTARIEFDAAGQPRLDDLHLTDPRWSRPYSGLYWQMDGSRPGSPQPGVLRSRSLWDAALVVAHDVLADGAVQTHELSGPDGSRVLLVARSVRSAAAGSAPWRVMVAANLDETQAAVDRFNGVLAASLAVLLGLLCAAAFAQVAIGLAPLRALRQALAAVRTGKSPTVEGRFPAEVQPLIDNFNSVLERNAAVVARARTQAGNLAHAIKTPLTVLAQAAAAAQQRPQAAGELAALVQEQTAAARRQVEWHLARSRAAAAQGLPGASVPVLPVLAGLTRVMERAHGTTRELALVCEAIDAGCNFAGELQDLQEILGNLLDNACKWARREVRVRVQATAQADKRRLHIVIDDDGPGITPDLRQAVMQRGARLDESMPGSGLGLAIVHELVGLYGGSVVLGDAALGGLRVEITLPGIEALGDAN